MAFTNLAFNFKGFNVLYILIWVWERPRKTCRQYLKSIKYR